MKMKEFGPRGGAMLISRRHIPGAPLDPPMLISRPGHMNPMLKCCAGCGGYVVET